MISLILALVFSHRPAAPTAVPASVPKCGGPGLPAPNPNPPSGGSLPGQCGVCGPCPQQ